jgi:hypothetical protein
MGQTEGLRLHPRSDGGGAAVGVTGLGAVGFVCFGSVVISISIGPRICDKECSEKDEIGMVSEEIPSMIACNAIKGGFQSLFVFGSYGSISLELATRQKIVFFVPTFLPSSLNRGKNCSQAWVPVLFPVNTF